MPDTSFSSEKPILSVIVVSYNTREMTLKCLRVLLAEITGIAAEVLVVDNASSDGSAEAIRTFFPKIRLISNPTNAGFGMANNLAMREAQGRFFLLLNTDAFPQPSAIPTLLEFLAAHPGVGVVGPRLLNHDGSLQTSCFRYTTPTLAWLENLGITKLFSHRSPFGNYGSWNHSSERDVDFVIGACLMLRREVYEQVGGFDENFFMYQEEADWQKRIRESGWRIVFTPCACVKHIGGASGRGQATRTNGHFFKSLDIYVLKHHGSAGFLLLRAAMVAGCAWRSVLWMLVSIAPRLREKGRNRVAFYWWLFQRQLLTRPPDLKRI